MPEYMRIYPLCCCTRSIENTKYVDIVNGVEIVCGEIQGRLNNRYSCVLKLYMLSSWESTNELRTNGDEARNGTHFTIDFLECRVHELGVGNIALVGLNDCEEYQKCLTLWCEGCYTLVLTPNSFPTFSVTSSASLELLSAHIVNEKANLDQLRVHAADSDVPIDHRDISPRAGSCAGECVAYPSITTSDDDAFFLQKCQNI